MLTGVTDESSGGAVMTGVKELVGAMCAPGEEKQLCCKESFGSGEKRLKGEMSGIEGRIEAGVQTSAKASNRDSDPSDVEFR